MNEAKEGLEIVATPSSGWCDPETGTCHLDSDDEAPDEERLSLSTR